jgi:hypothetical protein
MAVTPAGTSVPHRAGLAALAARDVLRGDYWIPLTPRARLVDRLDHPLHDPVVYD